MELLETMLNRRSVRTYTGEAVSEDALHHILQAGLLAPSGRNLCPVEFITVRDKSTLQQLARAKTAGAGMLNGASCAVAVVGDHEKSDTWIEDGSLAMIYMHLRATELGVAGCWVQCRNRTSQQREGEESLSSAAFVKGLLNIPERYSVLAILALGMADAPPTPHTADEVDFAKVHRETF